MRTACLDRWVPVCAVSVLGMLLSEALSFNAAPLVRAATHGPAAVIAAIAGVHVVYFTLFAVAVDVVVRFKIRDVVSLLLLGSVYGLLLEGVLAERIFLPAAGPSLLGVALASVAFPALCWHPAIDFTGAFLLLHALRQGTVRLGIERFLDLRAALVAALATGWLCCSKAPWLARQLPGGIPLALQALWVAYPLLVVGVTLRAAMARSGVVDGGSLLSWWQYPLVLAPVSVALVFRLGTLMSTGRAPAALCLLLLLGAYAGVSALWVARGRDLPERSIWADRGDPSAAFEGTAYLRLCAVVLGAWLVFLVISRPLGKLMALGCVGLAVTGVAFGAVFPVYVAVRLAGRCGGKKGRGR